MFRFIFVFGVASVFAYNATVIRVDDASPGSKCNDVIGQTLFWANATCQAYFTAAGAISVNWVIANSTTVLSQT
eukprot:UN12592